MVQESEEEVSIKNESPPETEVLKAVRRKSKGEKPWQEQQQQQQQVEEHWQWTSLRRKKSPVVFHSHREHRSSPCSNVPPKPEFPTAEVAQQESTPESALPNPAPSKPALANPVSISKTKITTEKAKLTDDLKSVAKIIGSQGHSKCAVEIPRLELTKAKEIALQAKLEAGAYVCQDCQAAVATSKGELGFQRRYPWLFFFCIFLNLLSILSFLFCIWILRTIYPHPAY